MTEEPCKSGKLNPGDGIQEMYFRLSINRCFKIDISILMVFLNNLQVAHIDSETLLIKSCTQKIKACNSPQFESVEMKNGS